MLGTLVRWYQTLKRRFTLGTDVGNGEYILPTGRDSVRYTRADYSVEVQVELRGGGKDYTIYAGTAKYWLPPHEDIPINDSERYEIVTAIGRYLDQSARTYEVKE